MKPKTNMKILAVIPARAGSKAIPNKNIRMVNGYPMAYYAIRNAMKSKFVTDVIVTTDSAEVKVLAEQLGARCNWRKSDLCGDDVTLDAVIYDAVPKNTMWDYIITMQPTSPTLKADTLDVAISYAMETGVDTLISAINSPELSWRADGNRKVPNYEKRLNRQYLPAYYKETGAFMISKGSAVSGQSRIGEVVDVFEIPENEAIDVDSFIDLQCVSAILAQKKIAVYVNGNKERGTGHIYRALEIADEFLSKPDIYYDINQTKKEYFGNTTHNLIPVNGIAELFPIIKEKGYDIFINDILATSLDYMIGLRTVMKEGAKIVNFEDNGEGATKADLVFNAMNSSESSSNVYGGEKYYIAPKLFMAYQPVAPRPAVSNVFISFGGADPQNYTDMMMGIITKGKYRDRNFTIVLGRAKENVGDLMESNKYDNIYVYYDVRNMT